MMKITNNKEGLADMLSQDSSTIKEVDTLVVAGGTLIPPPASSTLTNGNLFSLLQELYQSNIEPDLPTKVPNLNLHKK